MQRSSSQQSDISGLIPSIILELRFLNQIKPEILPTTLVQALKELRVELKSWREVRERSGSTSI